MLFFFLHFTNPSLISHPIRHNLKILGLLSSDSGMFQCIGTNQAGSVQASAFLEVLQIGMSLFLHSYSKYLDCLLSIIEKLSQWFNYQ